MKEVYAISGPKLGRVGLGSPHLLLSSCNSLRHAGGQDLRQSSSSVTVQSRFPQLPAVVCSESEREAWMVLRL